MRLCEEAASSLAKVLKDPPEGDGISGSFRGLAIEGRRLSKVEGQVSVGQYDRSSAVGLETLGKKDCGGALL